MIEIANPFIFFKYGIFQKAIVASLLSGILCSIVGVYVYLRKMTFIGAGLAHIAFAGISFGLLVGYFPMLWGFIFTLLAAIMVWFFSYRGKLTADSTVGILFATSMGLAVFLLSISGKYRAEALSYLFGSPLTVNCIDIVFLFLTCVLLLILVVYYYRDIYLTIFSEEIAKASGISTEKITFVATFFISVAVVSAMKAVGALLVFSLIVVPPAAAYEIAESFTGMILFSVLFASFSVVLGLFFSFFFNVPSGSMITFVAFAVFVLSYIKKWRSL
ncbi:metal ABC transporter permease [Desulfurobacterium atlanticum]|uniref:Zinc transport system permease protein n=1 Tax=Desulfurobacterium atlanticum TaxID=240169 RepID=A0A238XTX0_9BACT|nr:metal ABC transporter permease [Desulfurobacterium atlanticum]SNR61961.1 zinc transport system permease protein [Desulfurobacterium atlanticum]